MGKGKIFLYLWGDTGYGPTQKQVEFDLFLNNERKDREHVCTSYLKA